MTMPTSDYTKNRVVLDVKNEDKLAPLETRGKSDKDLGREVRLREDPNSTAIDLAMLKLEQENRKISRELGQPDGHEAKLKRERELKEFDVKARAAVGDMLPDEPATEHMAIATVPEFNVEDSLTVPLPNSADPLPIGEDPIIREQLNDSFLVPEVNSPETQSPETQAAYQKVLDKNAEEQAKKDAFLNKPLNASTQTYAREDGKTVVEVKIQPDPVQNDEPHSHDLLIEDIKARKAKGVETYGTALQAFNGRDSLWDAYEEIIDLAVYLRTHIEEQERIEAALIVAELLAESRLNIINELVDTHRFGSDKDMDFLCSRIKPWQKNDYGPGASVSATE